MNVIETSGLCKQFDSHFAVDHVAMAVPEGCVYGFIGPNGAGKSTTMKMLLGLCHPTAGHVQLLGKAMNDQNRLALLRQTGSLIENPSCYGHLTAEENLQIVADLKGVDKKDIDRVLDIVHLQKDRRRKVGQYSLGMRQRLGIAMALLGSPRLLILDEPTNGLDPAGIQEMRALIAGMPLRLFCALRVFPASQLHGAGLEFRDPLRQLLCPSLPASHAGADGGFGGSAAGAGLAGRSEKGGVSHAEPLYCR